MNIPDVFLVILLAASSGALGYLSAEWLWHNWPGGGRNA